MQFGNSQNSNDMFTLPIVALGATGRTVLAGPAVLSMRAAKNGIPQSILLEQDIIIS